MKDIITIVFRLTVSCLLAGLVMGGAFVLTNKAKRHNIEANEQAVMFSLLGYSAKTPAPTTVAMHEIYRYLVTDGSGQSMGYLVPLASGHGAFTFVAIDLDGKGIGQTPVSLEPEKARDEAERTAAITAVLGSGKTLRYADQTIVVTDNGKRKAYLLPGKFPGFKTFISAILALDPKFTVIGMEIMEHEEDPGLGAEIAQKYFKNQFKAKTIATMKGLEVAKTPLPDEYRQALMADGGDTLNAEAVAKIEEKYSDKAIYALTGATISSRSVTNGVKGMVQKFAYRLDILDRVLNEQHIAVPF